MMAELASYLRLNNFLFKLDNKYAKNIPFDAKRYIG